MQRWTHIGRHMDSSLVGKWINWQAISDEYNGNVVVFLQSNDFWLQWRNYVLGLLARAVWCHIAIIKPRLWTFSESEKLSYHPIFYTKWSRNWRKAIQYASCVYLDIAMKIFKPSRKAENSARPTPCSLIIHYHMYWPKCSPQCTRGLLEPVLWKKRCHFFQIYLRVFIAKPR